MESEVSEIEIEPWNISGREVEALVTVKGRERMESPKEGRFEPERRRMREPLMPLEFLARTKERFS